jgi:hypothetical protein
MPTKEPVTLTPLKIRFADNMRDAEPDSPHTEVFNYESELTGEPAADEAFALFNMPDESLPSERRELVSQYRLKRLRSLSVGDIVHVGEEQFYCDSFSWKLLEASA